MSRISEERKEILLRRYGNINTAAGSGAMEPGRGKMSGGFGGPGGKRPLGFGVQEVCAVLWAVPNRKMHRLQLTGCWLISTGQD